MSDFPFPGVVLAILAILAAAPVALGGAVEPGLDHNTSCVIQGPFVGLSTVLTGPRTCTFACSAGQSFNAFLRGAFSSVTAACGGTGTSCINDLTHTPDCFAPPATAIFHDDVGVCTASSGLVGFAVCGQVS